MDKVSGNIHSILSTPSGTKENKLTVRSCLLLLLPLYFSNSLQLYIALSMRAAAATEAHD